ncbi:MAG: hypothetical protein K1W24_15640 [Lachnospiraceae bacterium]
MEHVYKAALYLRLSKDDTATCGSIKKESNSIASQRDLVKRIFAIRFATCS